MYTNSPDQLTFVPSEFTLSITRDDGMLDDHERFSSRTEAIIACSKRLERELVVQVQCGYHVWLASTPDTVQKNETTMGWATIVNSEGHNVTFHVEAVRPPIKIANESVVPRMLHTKPVPDDAKVFTTILQQVGSSTQIKQSYQSVYEATNQFMHNAQVMLTEWLMIGHTIKLLPVTNEDTLNDDRIVHELRIHSIPKNVKDDIPAITTWTLRAD